MTHTNLYPGMICTSTEFFIHKDELKVMSNGEIKNFIELPFATIELLREAISSDHNVNLALHDLQPTSKMKRIKQFARCRFGGLDFEGDIKNGELQDGEFWPCPNHGNCKHEGILCKLPKVNGQRLSKKEVRFLQLSATDYTNDVIAEKMNMPLGTLHQLKKTLYKLLGIQTKQEGSVLSRHLNLI
ncbi:helix-turn-helix transcriptional regulator [Flavobacterium psychrophilum]|uniref:helix-turn-helix transcriptional regulator n=1 Tax=Flavobacterium psychrophilum TaxID=96345 RepID=UPI00193173CC|nr:hypothetical protein [Flavobacterium psychrophilum]QRE14648.1 hypothetical protein H0I38_04590 [Flavobacterium psychrophilum]